MPMSLKDCFAHFGAQGKNPHWSVSAISADRKTVVLALWRDRLDYSSNPIVYDIFGAPDLPEIPGNQERIENLKWARDHCDGLFRVVIAVAKNTRVTPRSIGNAHPHDRLLMRLVDLNEITGEFRAINVGN